MSIYIIWCVNLGKCTKKDKNVLVLKSAFQQVVIIFLNKTTTGMIILHESINEDKKLTNLNCLIGLYFFFQEIIFTLSVVTLNNGTEIFA